MLAEPVSTGNTTTPIDAIVVQGREVGITGTCPPKRGVVKVIAAGTEIMAGWSRCGSLHHVRLAAVIQGDCTSSTAINATL